MSEKPKRRYHFGGLAVNERMYEKKGSYRKMVGRVDGIQLVQRRAVLKAVMSLHIS